MEFENIRIDKVRLVIKYKATKKIYTAQNRHDHIIGIALSGSEAHDLGYQQFTIGTNCVYFLNQRDDFKVLAHEAALCYSVHFTTTEPITTDSFCLKVNSSDEILRLIDKINKRFVTGGELKLFSSVYELLGMLEDLHKKTYYPADERAVKAREFMDLNFRRADCLKTVYEQSGISRRHFDHVFRKTFDTSPGKYIITKKISLAKELLSTPHLSMEEISQMCGFSGAYYFSRLFKAETGVTPTEYKNGRH